METKAKFNYKDNVLRMDRLFKNIDSVVNRAINQRCDPLWIMTSAKLMTEIEAGNLLALHFYTFKTPKDN